jgi:hypothetical protein
MTETKLRVVWYDPRQRQSFRHDGAVAAIKDVGSTFKVFLKGNPEGLISTFLESIEVL